MGGTAACPAGNVNRAKPNYRKAKKNKIKAHKGQLKRRGIRKLRATNAPENRVNKKRVKKLQKRAKLWQKPKAVAAIGENLLGGAPVHPDPQPKAA